MTSSEGIELWAAIQSHLRTSIGDVLFDNWFRGTKLKSWDGRTLSLYVSNSYCLSEYSNREFDGYIKRSAREILNMPLRVEFSLEGTKP